MAQPRALGFQFMLCQPLQRSLAAVESVEFRFGPDMQRGSGYPIPFPKVAGHPLRVRQTPARVAVNVTACCTGTARRAARPALSYYGVEALLRFQCIATQQHLPKCGFKRPVTVFSFQLACWPPAEGRM